MPEPAVDLETNDKDNDRGNNQNLVLFIRGSAISGAQLLLGKINKFHRTIKHKHNNFIEMGLQAYLYTNITNDITLMTLLAITLK